ncbi:MAG: hypothetical protein C5B51_17900 [Terriglobia bacterium]|nr:MAG: hypothetical protein C5B51_17900 [Terriglobia bacterium]
MVLYELLTGRSPYRTSEPSAHALVDAICHQPPELPSVAVKRQETSVSTAARRATEPQSLRNTLAGDLDAILLTALQKNPDRRYPSVAAFSADIHRHLEGQPIQAHRPWPLYSWFFTWSWKRAAAALLVLFLMAAPGVLWYRSRTRAIAVRPSIAVLGFENLSRQPSEEWLGTALTEMLSTELAAGGHLRTIPGELVSRVKFELALPNAQTFTSATLERLRRSLSADYVVLGSYLALGEGRAQQVRLDLRLQDTKTGDLVTSVSETEPASQLLPLVARAGATLRRQLGAGEVFDAASSALRSSLPEGGDAARNYSEGLQRLRTFDTLAARDLLRNAVTAAPGHALSHAALAAASSLLGYDVEARDEAKKALDLSAGLSREDQLSIQGQYFETTRNWPKAVETYRTLRTDFPDNIEYGLCLAAAQTEAGTGRAALETIAGLRVLGSSANDPRVDLAETDAALSVSDLPVARAAAARAAQSGTTQGLRILVARARLLETRIFIQMGDPQRALAAAAESQKLYQAAGHRQGVAWAMVESAAVLTQLGNVAGARARYEESLGVCRTTGDQGCIGADLDSIGVLRRRQGDLQGALQMHQQAIEIRRAVGDRAGVAAALYNLANVFDITGNLPRAAQSASEALELRRTLGDSRSAALTLGRLANIQRQLGQLEDALAKNEQAAAQLRSIGDRGGTALAQYYLGLALFDKGDLARARSMLEEALAVRREQRDRNNTAQVLAALAPVALAQDKISEARTLIGESIKLREELGELISLAQSRLILAQVLLEERQADAAESAALEASARFRAAHADALEAEALLIATRARLVRSRAGQARQAFDAANLLLRDSKDVRLLLLRDTVSAQIEFAMGRKEAAGSILERALAEAARLGCAGAQFTIRLAQVQMGAAPAPQLASDARQAGFLLIARQAGSAR